MSKGSGNRSVKWQVDRASYALATGPAADWTMVHNVLVVVTAFSEIDAIVYCKRSTIRTLSWNLTFPQFVC